MTRPTEELPDCTLIMIVEGDCATGVAALDEDVKRCVDGWSFGDAFRDPMACLRDLATNFADNVDFLPPMMQAQLKVLLGCARYVGDVAMGIWAATQELYAYNDDPVGYVQSRMQAYQEIYAALEADPRAFAEEFLREELDVDLLLSEPEQWVGKIGCEIIVAIFGAGVIAGTGRIVRLIDRLDDIRDWSRNKRDRDHADTCDNNSFPTGTPVRMANGTLKPIELIQPGDQVLAANPRTRHWEPQVVFDQWSYVDRGRMTTATLTNGTTITATDHHQFWVTNTNTWHRLDQIRPGDRLLTPHGTTTVTNVDTSNPTTTLVWELHTTTHKTFTVHTGTHDLLVHNCTPGMPRDPGWTDARQRHVLDGDRTGGWHHRSNGRDPNGNKILRVMNQVTSGKLAGVYVAEVEICRNGRCRTKPSTFFPDSWTRSDVINAIDEAYNNAWKLGIVEPHKPIIAKTNTGFPIEFLVDDDGEILTAFPNLDW